MEYCVLMAQGNGIAINRDQDQIIWEVIMGIINQFERESVLKNINTRQHFTFCFYTVRLWKCLNDYSQCYKIDYSRTRAKSAVSEFAEQKYNQTVHFVSRLSDIVISF